MRILSSDAAGLVILLHGLAFRSSGKAPQDNNAPLHASATRNEQFNALQSFQQHVMAPAAARGWSVLLASDLVMPQAQQTLWTKVCHHSGVKPTHQRIRSSYGFNLQTDTVKDSLAWVTRVAPEAWSMRGALLLVRVDLVLRRPLQLPPPPRAGQPGSTMMMVPFVHSMHATYIHHHLVMC